MDVEISNPGAISSNPLLSVHMITYQHARYISQAIESVLMQKVSFSFELCIGEDGSTDGTREICTEYAKKHPDKIRLFLRDRNNPERKQFTAPYMFNCANTFDACRGKYTALLEGDDYWTYPGKLQAQIEKLESDDTLGAACHYSLTMADNKPWLSAIAPTQPIHTFTIENILARDVGNIHTSTWVIRRRHGVNWERFRTSIFGDYPIFVSALLGGGACMIPQVWSVYRQHDSGVFSPLSTEKRWDANVNLWKCLKSAVPNNIHTSANIGLSRTLSSYTRALCKNGKYGAATRCLWKNLNEIRNVPDKKKRNKLRLLAMEAFLLPRFEGLKNRLRNRNN